MSKLFSSLILFVAILMGNPMDTHAETTECTEITSLPTIITVQGVYCLKQNLTTSIAAGNAIEIQTNNVIIDLNGWKLGGRTAGDGTQTNGIYADDQNNIVVRNGSILGFYSGVYLTGDETTSSGHRIEGILADGNRRNGIRVDGSNITIRNNNVVNTGSSAISSSAFGIASVNGNGKVIEGNTVSGIEETNSAYGIYFTTSDGVKVFNNNVFDLENATDRYGITMVLVNRALIKGNNVSVATGTIGIGDISNITKLACVRNEVAGFTNNVSGCDALSSNVTY